MIRYLLTNLPGHPVGVCLDSQRLDGVAPIWFDGRRSMIDVVRWHVEGASGPRGVRLGEVASPRELYYAMTYDPILIGFAPRLVEGRALLTPLLGPP